MANILLTQRCTRSCPYCFAIKHMDTSPPEDILSWENLIYLADFMQAAGERRVQFLGGEPTLHPQFIDFCLYIINRGMGITVFTNGMMPSEKLADAVKHFAQLPDEMLSFVCNINHPDITPKGEMEMALNFLKAFGRRITPGFNIYRKEIDIDFIFDYINKYGLQRGLRLGLAHPIPGVKNRYVKIQDMRNVVQGLMSYQGYVKEICK